MQTRRSVIKRGAGYKFRCRDWHWLLDADGTVPDPISTHWPGDILDLLVAEILEDEVELIPNLIPNDPAYADTPGLGQPFQPRRYIHPVSEDVLALGNYVAQVDPHAELDPSLWRGALIPLRHAVLHLYGAPDGIHDARKLRQEAVAGVLYDPAPVVLDLRIDQFPEVGLESFVGPFLIRPHQARVPRHIGGEDRSEAADRGMACPAVRCL